MPDCAHRKLQTWHFTDNDDVAGMWSCVGCGTKFVPITELLAAEKEVERVKMELQTALGKVWILETQIADAKPAPGGALIDAAGDGWSDPVGKRMREQIDAPKD